MSDVMRLRREVTSRISRERAESRGGTHESAVSADKESIALSRCVPYRCHRFTQAHLLKIQIKPTFSSVL